MSFVRMRNEKTPINAIGFLIIADDISHDTRKTLVSYVILASTLKKSIANHQAVSLFKCTTLPFARQRARYARPTSHPAGEI